MQIALSPEYTKLTSEEYFERIEYARKFLGDKLVILGHHYQRDEIIRHADYRGDSYKLAQHAQSHQEAQYIVFCGVHFMAESADILKPGNQKVILPNLAAGCSMADMANIFQVERCWNQLESIFGGGRNEPGSVSKSGVVPVTYINSAANLKSFVGENGGTVCTSTNAPKALEWALTQGSRVLFFPDQHLGRNTAAAMGFDIEKDMCVWDPFKPNGGNSEEQLKKSKFILWKGHCSVHKRFTVDQINGARKANPQVQVLVHPECEYDVVRAADFYGSTEFILQTVEKALPGSAWAIGTEVNLVNRMAKEMPDRSIHCLDPQICPCSTMYRIHPSFLCWALEELIEGRIVNQISVQEDIANWARVALQRMLDITGPKPRLSD